MSAIRVMVVDDSVVIRKLLTQTLATDPAIEVVASASLGKIALAKIPQVNPEVVILDVEMPEMDGLETLTLIRKDWPRLPVIMFSTKTERGAVTTIEALTRGASDYVPKPSNTGSMALAMERVREAMIPKIKALVPRGPKIQPKPVPITPLASAIAPKSPLLSTPAGKSPLLGSTPAGKSPLLSSTPAGSSTLLGGGVGARMSAPPVAPRIPALVPGTEVPVALVAIGASTGGPNALSLVLPKLRRDFPVPVVVVQHMLPTFTHHFAVRLDSQCQLRVVEPKSGDRLQPGFIYIAPGDYHLVVGRRGREGFATLNQAAPENFCRPAVDVMFDSAASSYGASVLGVVLTGMGQDGYRGATLIRQAGGNVIVQDEATSVVWGMPGFVANAGLATQILPIESVAGEIERLVDRVRSPRLEAATSR